MIVFDYFLGKMNVFGDLINAKAEIEEDEDLEVIVSIIKVVCCVFV